MSAAIPSQSAEIAALFGTAVMPEKLSDHIVFSEITTGRDYDIDGICSFCIQKVNSLNTFVNKNFLHWYKTDEMTITPAEGIAIRRISMHCTDTPYCWATVANVGDSSTNNEALNSTWIGNQTEPFTLTTSNGQLRVPYLTISYEKSNSPAGILDSEPAEEDASIEYYNLQGVRIQNPTPGTICLKRSGKTVSKILVP